MTDRLTDEQSAGMFRKKPVVISARRASEAELIETLEGTMRADPGDWIITGVKGERYPCKPNIFEATYEPASALREQSAPSDEIVRSQSPRYGLCRRHPRGQAMNAAEIARLLSDEAVDAALAATATFHDIKGTQLTINREKMRLRLKAWLKHTSILDALEQARAEIARATQRYNASVEMGLQADAARAEAEARIAELEAKVADLEFFRDSDIATVKAHFDENNSLRARLDVAAEALREIGQQKTTDQLPEWADLEVGYNECVRRARAALAEIDAVKPKE